MSVMTLTPALPQGPAGRVGEGSEDEVEAASRRPLVTTVITAAEPAGITT